MTAITAHTISQSAFRLLVHAESRLVLSVRHIQTCALAVLGLFQQSGLFNHEHCCRYRGAIWCLSPSTNRLFLHSLFQVNRWTSGSSWLVLVVAWVWGLSPTRLVLCLESNLTVVLQATLIRDACCSQEKAPLRAFCLWRNCHQLVHCRRQLVIRQVNEGLCMAR